MCVRLNGLSRTRLVADPFLGLGSTAVACAQLGISFAGIELDEGYLLEAVERTRAALDARDNGHRRRPRKAVSADRR
jgi:site-specific DNA-methyltransferase (adenine-specific)